MAKTASDILADRLIAWGVDTIFGFPGDGINGFFEALRTHQDQLRFIQVRHEEAAAFAACAYAKFTGKLGVCVATSGPGAIHLLNGLYDAKMDGAPVLAITGQQYSDLLGMSYQQEVDLVGLFRDVSVYDEQIQGSSDVYNLADTAIRTALARRGVAHLTFPIDYQVAPGKEAFYSHHGGPNLTPTRTATFAPGFYAVDGREMQAAATWDQTGAVAGAHELQAAADVLNSGQRVAILAGHGAIHARAEVEQIAELLGAPIVKPLLGKGVVPDNSPYTTGGIGLLGTKPSEDVMDQCDTLFIIGSSYPYPNFLAKPGQARGVQIDIDHTRLGLRFPIEVGLAGDSQSTLRALLPLLRRKTDRSFLEMAQKGMQAWRHMIDAEGTSTDLPMKPQAVAWALNELAASDAIICGDSGTNTTWIARNFELKENQMFSCSGNLATMAPGLPYAVGAQVAYPNRQVIAFVGDGGFTMLMGEVMTAVKYNLPIKVIIIKNDVLGQIKWEQIVFLGNPQFAVQLQPCDFAAYARACGAEGYACDDPTKIKDVMREFLASPRPAVLEAIVDPNVPPLPATIKPEQAEKFALALAKGQREGPRIALTAFREKFSQMLEDNDDKGVVSKALDAIGDMLNNRTTLPGSKSHTPPAGASGPTASRK